MNKILITLLISITLASCSKNINKAAQKQLNGHWTITDVNYSEPLVNVNAFGEFDSKCLEQSQWHFISNNNKGSFTINGKADCPVGTTNIVWFVDANNNLAIKRLLDGQSARNVKQGYYYNLQNQSQHGFELIHNVDGLNIRYRFVKVGN